ncbi:RES domain-containing protein [Flavobacterium chilense]|uniref:RES domain-containing protein n=1 Tax=Flavobacterium chilense TaxID=946677 RepID=A0A1M7IQJ6_9FLAO|nr:RES domain-containing protein [Flavobacterium chilense]SHM43084.1 RES domain-containing protein [Flavobacterium chilense]
MIEKITKNKDNLGEPDLEPIEKIVEKLNYYRSLFGKIQDLTDEEFENLRNDISKFFTLKVGSNTDQPPKRLIRISNNNRILEAQGKELSYLTDISQLLAPPIDYCNFGRCNIPKQQVLYCATSEAGAYWETKPQNGDVITISHFELKPNTKVNSFIVKKELTKNPEIKSKLHEVYYLLEEFFEEIYSLRISRDRPRDYLFTGQISSDQLFYPVVSELNFDAILYPSVQRKKHGWNVAIRNELILERYNLIGVETRFILDEYDILDHTSEEVTTDQIIGSFGTEAFDFENGKILYDEEKANKAFKIFRMLQVGEGKQIRNEEEGLPKNLLFNFTPQNYKKETKVSPSRKLGRNDRINVVYQNGKRIDNIKYKKVQSDVEQGKCRITKH